MRNRINYTLCFISILFCVSCINSKNISEKNSIKTKSFPITGKVEQVFNYCGGTRPTQEILNNFAKPKPFSDKTFYIKKGTTNTEKAKVITSFTTNADGSFTVQLPEGIYSIIVSEQLHPVSAKDFENKNQRVDEECLQEWWKTPYYILEVKTTKNSPLYFLFEHQCRISHDIPCINYIGPLPQ